MKEVPLSAGMSAMVRHGSLLRLTACMCAVFTVNDYFYIGSQVHSDMGGQRILND